MYRLVNHENGLPSPCVFRQEDRAIIPFDPANTDYQQYLAWLAEGNEPLPADEPEQVNANN